MKILITFLVAFCIFRSSQAKVFQLPKSSNFSRATEESKKELLWWQDTIFYQIYPRSFKDSDKDGIGDLKGVTEKLQYLKDSGIDGAWLSPIFKSPMVDFGYDISDYRAIQKEYGTMEDFEELMRVAKEVGIKIVLDFVPNHTSDQHEWFQKSIKRDPEYENYYVWHDGKKDKNGKPEPPNNWLSVFRGSAWTWNEERQQYYLHQFAAAQPDLNFREPKMVEAMKEVLRFWLDKGIDGFRIDAVPYLVEDDHFKDEPLSNNPGVGPEEFEYLDHIYTVNRPMNFEVIREWCDTVEEWSKTHDKVPKVMMTEAYASIDTQIEYYKAGVSFTFNFVFVGSVRKTSTAKDLKDTIERWSSKLPSEYTSNWVIGNHDNDRIGTNVGTDKIDGVNMMVLILPGIGITYYGEEIGMENGHVTWEEHQDTTCTKENFEKGKCRDFARTPFQWDDSHMAGFTSGDNPWLPVDPSYVTNNLKAQQAAKKSHYKVYTEMAKLRKQDTLRLGKTEVKATDNNVLIIERTLEGEPTYTFVFNLGDKLETIKLADEGEGAVVVRSSYSPNYVVGGPVKLKEVRISPSAAYVIKSFATSIVASCFVVFLCAIANLLK